MVLFFGEFANKHSAEPGSQPGSFPFIYYDLPFNNFPTPPGVQDTKFAST